MNCGKEKLNLKSVKILQMMILISILLIIVAAIASAAVDTILHHGGGWLKRKYGNFFDINIQGKFFWFTKYPVDGYHLFKSIRICSYLAAISISLPHGWLWFIVFGIIYNIIFNRFWNKFFK